MATSRISDRLRAVPAPAALILIAGASFVGVPFVASMFGAGATRAEAMPSNATGHVRTGAGGLPASMPTYMPSLTGSASPMTYAAPQVVASTGYAAGIGDGASSAGAGAGAGSGGSSNARQHQSKTADQTRTAPADRPRSHLASRGSVETRVDRHAAAASGPVHHHDLPSAIRPMMPMRVAPAAPITAVQPHFAFARPAMPMPFFGGGMMRGSGGFRSFGGGGRHR